MAIEREIAEEMRGVAEAYPWVPTDVPPQRHYRDAGNLRLCFTLDVLPGRQLYHLSMVRKNPPTPPSDEEVRVWCRAFFGDTEPLEVPNQVPEVPSRHFFWEARVINFS